MYYLYYTDEYHNILGYLIKLFIKSAPKVEESTQKNVKITKKQRRLLWQNLQKNARN